jgi:hypothetical protein
MTTFTVLLVIVLSVALLVALVREIRSDRPANPPRSRYDDLDGTYLPRWV